MNVFPLYVLDTVCTVAGRDEVERDTFGIQDGALNEGGCRSMLSKSLSEAVQLKKKDKQTQSLKEE